MKTCLIALAVSAGLAPVALVQAAYAAEIAAASRIDSVTVFPQGADVTRLVEMKVPADENTLVLDDIPQEADPQSIRVEGAAEGAVKIASVDTRTLRQEGEAGDEMRRKLSRQIESLQDERAALDQQLSDKEAERNLLLSLASRTFEGKGENAKPLDAAGIDGLVGTVATRLAATSKSIQDSRIRQRAIDKEVAELSVQMNEQSPANVAHLQVKVHVLAPHEADAKLKVTYRVQQAGWHAFYDARLSLPQGAQDARVSLVRQAEVMQRTGESWNNVKFTLSTATPSQAAQAPGLDEAEVSILEPPVAYARKAEVQGQVAKNKIAAPALKDDKLVELDAASEEAADLPASAPVAMQQAEVQQAGFTAQYVIAARGDVDNLGTAKAVRIGEDELTVKLSAESAPRLDGNAYLTAAFTAKADEPLLAGPVHLFREQAFVGQVDMPELAGGEEAKLGFGVDDLVKIKRAEVKRLAAEEGLLSTSNTQEVGWVISVNNLHDFKMPIRVLDRKPYSSNAQIVVSDREGNTLASVTDLDHKRGVLAWDMALEPKAKAEIKTGYKVSAPKDVRVSLVD